jgi:hypothetical protein
MSTQVLLVQGIRPTTYVRVYTLVPFFFIGVHIGSVHVLSGLLYHFRHKRGENQKSSWSASWCACSILLHILRFYISWSFTAFRLMKLTQVHDLSTASIIDPPRSFLYWHFCSHALVNQPGWRILDVWLVCSDNPSPTSMFSRNRLNVKCFVKPGWRIHRADDSLWYDFQNIQYFLRVDVSKKLEVTIMSPAVIRTTQHLIAI